MIRKGFKGARILDLENKVLNNIPPIQNTNDFDMKKTIIDDENVHIATLTTNQGAKVRVKRNFKGARIVKLEEKARFNNAHLIGETVKNEDDF
mmetsp:Transcript_30328/g.5478  ORF Transcript_30328/g.5478 Transcript_30328/m.5478 type:complete len:93 (+) Transcript_30328:757-1035(+)